MKLIIGLGNPGAHYAPSRHNIGFSVVRALGKLHKAAFKRDIGTSSLSAKIRFGGQNVLLALPLTYMNLSGNAACALLKKYKIDISDLLVVCDDLDLELSRLKIKPCGSSAGHNGMQSIIEALGSSEFSRLRLGINRPPRNVDPAEYVLTSFSRKEKEEANQVIERAVECSESWIRKGITETMNMFNRTKTIKGD